MTRSQQSLPESGFVFCCFNNALKITPQVFDIWMRILHRVDASVLWLVLDNPEAGRNLKREAEARGIAPDRLIFAERMTLPEHLARHHLADLFLDTLPWNAHATASLALWTGLPVLTRSGNSFASRVAASLLHTTGVPELITTTPADYENRAVTLATQPDLLATLRSKIQQNRQLFEPDRFARSMEAAYRSMLGRLPGQ